MGSRTTSCFSAEVLEGYGQTETCAALTLTRPGDYTSGHVGAPIPCCGTAVFVTADHPKLCGAH